MATIALYAGKINNMPGLIKDVRKSVEKYNKELAGLYQKTLKVDVGVCDLGEVMDSLRASSQTQEQRIEILENFQENSEDFIQDTIRIDNNVADTVDQNKDDFYDKYDYLKPDCEKSGWEKFCDACKAVGEWCKEHWIAIVTAIAVIIVAIVATVFIGLAAVIAICSAIAFFATAGDFIATLITGKDIYTLLKESGNPVLAEIFAGIQWGATISAAVLSFYQLGTQIAKVGLKGFLTGGEKGLGILKYHWKNIWGGIKADFKSVFGSGHTLTQRLKAVWNIVVLNQSGDFSFKESISAYRNGEAIIRGGGTGSKHVSMDENGNYYPKSEELKETLSGKLTETGSIPTTQYGNSVDYDWGKIGQDTGKQADFMKIYSEYKDDILTDQFDTRKILWKDAGVSAVPGMTRHELYNVQGGKVSIYQVPKDAHRMLTHNGGVSVIEDIWQKLGSGTLFVEERQVIRRLLFSEEVSSLVSAGAN